MMHSRVFQFDFSRKCTLGKSNIKWVLQKRLNPFGDYSPNSATLANNVGVQLYTSILRSRFQTPRQVNPGRSKQTLCPELISDLDSDPRLHVRFLSSTRLEHKKLLVDQLTGVVLSVTG